MTRAQDQTAAHVPGRGTGRAYRRRVGAAVPLLALLVVLALTGCRDGGRARGSGGAGGAGDGAAPAPAASARAGSVAGVEGTPATDPNGQGSATDGRSPGGTVAGDLAAVDRDLAGLSTADAEIGADLGAAANEAAQPDDG